MSSPRPSPRGQTLVLFTLSLLLIVLLTLMTVSFSAKAKEKMELQTMADAGAYSQAVATARTYNSIALMNRAQISHVITMAGLQSALSFSSSLVSYSNYAAQYFTRQKDRSCAAPGCAAECVSLGLRLSAILQGAADAEARMRALESRVALRITTRQGLVNFLYEQQLQALRKLDAEGLDDQRLLASVVQGASSGSAASPELEVLPGPASINRREAGVDLARVLSGAVLPYNHPAAPAAPNPQVHAVMGSIGNPFITGRTLDPKIHDSIRAVLQRVGVQPSEISLIEHWGSAWLSGGRQVHANHPDRAGPVALEADDHGFVTLAFDSSCRPDDPVAGPVMAVPVTPTANALSLLRTTDPLDMTDGHWWMTNSGNVTSDPSVIGHSGVLPCRDALGGRLGCPSLMPLFIHSNTAKLTDPGDLFGQPKNLAVLRRNYRARPGPADPWNLAFRFRFGPPGGGSDVDLRGLVLRDGTDISAQSAIAAGVTYYHRAGRWREPPNTFNPFWRAGLARLDVDQESLADVPAALASGAGPWTAEAWSELWNAGYRGVP